jgi:hypothetical protein
MAIALLATMAGATREAEARICTPDPSGFYYCLDFGWCGDGLCIGVENTSTCPTDCGTGPVCGDGVCNGVEDCGTCAGDCGACPPCAPWARSFSAAGSFFGDYVSGFSSFSAGVNAAGGTFSDAIDLLVDSVILGNYFELVQVGVHGTANGGTANGDVLVQVFGFDIYPPTSTTGGTVGPSWTFGTWGIFTVGGSYSYCYYGLCVSLTAAAGIYVSVGVAAQETVSATDVRGSIGPWASLDATINGGIGVCGGDCSISSLTATVSGSLNIATLNVGGVAQVTKTGSATAFSDLGLDVWLSMGSGSVNLAVTACLFGACITPFSWNVANWAAPFFASWPLIGGVASHCL